MKDHYSYSDSEFEENFENSSFPPELFTHEAHLRLAWIYVLKYGSENACDLVCNQIEKFDSTHGDGTKYHKTLTVAAVKSVNHFINKSKSIEFWAFIQEFPRLKTNFKELLDQHYGYDLFGSEEARRSFLKPDLLPFD